jgi:Uma2 family endonuclease
MEQKVLTRQEGAAAAEPKPFLWTSEEYYRLSDRGFFQGRRVQLIEGEILEMAAQTNFHAAAISLTEDALRAAFGPGCWVRVQMSLDLTPLSVPDPDLAVVPGSPHQVVTASNPTSALLIVEVSDTTLSFDRRGKASLYARAGIADYWIVNLKHRQLEVRRKPVPDRRQRYKFRYGDESILQLTESVTPLPAPQARIPVADLFP